MTGRLKKKSVLLISLFSFRQLSSFTLNSSHNSNTNTMQSGYPFESKRNQDKKVIIQNKPSIHFDPRTRRIAGMFTQMHYFMSDVIIASDSYKI